ncbi:MAG: HNH endonuclease [Burkholderiaceae bacterium]|nr:HNH endonuclease [Burkholderiaceae bacterium]
MFNSYTNLDLATARRYLNAIPVNQRQAVAAAGKWQRLSNAIGCAPLKPLAAEDMPTNGSIPVTTVLSTVHARRGQEQFRADLMQVWGGACAVTGLTCNEVLRASHVKPWANSTAPERLDSNNGLLLSANLDALFDKGLITFDNNGQMQISPRLSASHRTALSLPMALRHVPNQQLAVYLDHHRKNVFH